MGFSLKQATKALKSADNDFERALDWVFSHPDDLGVEDEPEFRDGLESEL